MSPTARTLGHLRALGALAEVVERRIPHTNITRDLFGFIDIVAIEVGAKGLLGVQTTSMAHRSSRVKKVLAEPRARLWLEAGNRIRVMAWEKRGPRGMRKVWMLSTTSIALAEDQLCVV